MKRLFATTRNGVPVYFDPLSSHSATHFKENPQLRSLAKEVVQLIDAKTNNIQADHDFGRVVGYSDVVTTDDASEIFYAKRRNRKIYSRFTKGESPEPSSYVTVVLQRIRSGYLLLSAWIGPSVPPFPGDKREWPESREFWETHALILGRQGIDETTITTICPWSN